MGNEFDYSGLYHNNENTGGNPAPDPQGSTAQPGASAANSSAQPQANSSQGQPENSGYPNVGSSGSNTANVPHPDYTQPDAAAGSQPNAGSGASTSDGYTSSMHSGAQGGYSYSSAPTPPPRKPLKKGSGKKIALRIVAGIAVIAVGFASGFGGAMAASRLGLAGNNVVMQTVVRDDDSDASSTQGSATGDQLSTKEVAALVSPSVVVITTEQMVSSNSLWFGGSYVQSGAGSGVIISQDGYILTCAHVVAGATNINVQLNGSDDQYTATVVGSDTVSDVAVLKIDATGLTPAVIGDSDKLAVGEEVIAVGNPLGTLGGTVTNGIVSALNREITVEGNDMTLIQMSAAVSPGNSGGGLFNTSGELVGIVNAKSDSSDAEGLGFAIPVNTATKVAEDLVENGYVPRPALGIKVLTISDSQTAMQYGVETFGVYIVEITSGGAAENSGLQVGDRIVSVDDVAVSQNTDVTSYLQGKNVGDTVTLQVERDGKLMSFDVTLGSSTQAQ